MEAGICRQKRLILIFLFSILVVSIAISNSAVAQFSDSSDQERFIILQEGYLMEDRIINILSDEDLLDLRSIVFAELQEGFLFNTLFRWEKPIRFGLLGVKYIKDRTALANEVINVTFGVASRLVEASQVSSKPNFLIVFSDNVYDDALTKHRQLFMSFTPSLDEKFVDSFVGMHRESGSSCFTYFGLSIDPVSIANAILFIDTSLGSRELRNCLTAEIVRSLGLIGFSKNPTSILFNGNNHLTPGDIDLAYLELIYNISMPKGVSRENFIMHSKKIIQELQD